MKVKLKDVLANPFRDMSSYPINQSKITQLKRSIETTDFWDNIVARKCGDQIEIAYGHHRLTALREMYDGEKSFNFIVRDLSDTEMIQIMAHENLDEWGHDSAIERETIRAVVSAFADGKIAMKRPKGRDDKLRYAPGFCLGRSSRGDTNLNLAYTAETVAAFLGGTMAILTVGNTLRALEMLDAGELKEDQLKGLTSNKARDLVAETKRAVRQAALVIKAAEREALSAATPILQKKIKREGEKRASAIVKRTANVVSSALQKGGSLQEAKAAGVDARMKMNPSEKEVPEINDAATRIASQLRRLLDPDYDPAKKLLELIKHKKHLTGTSVQNLDRALEVLGEYVEGYRANLKNK